MRTSLLSFLFSSVFSLGLAALLAPLSGGCAATAPVTVVRLHPGETPQGAGGPGDPLKVRRGAQDAYSGLRGGFFVVRTADDWQRLWPAGPSHSMPPTLDTSRSMLLLAVAEGTDTEQVHVQKVLDAGEYVHVWVRETRAGEGCAKKAESEAFDAVVVQRLDKPVRFFVVAEPGESCGPPPTAEVRCRLAGAEKWSEKLTAQPGDAIDCELTGKSRGKFEVTDRVLALGSLPGGSGSKLAFTSGSARGTFTLDVFGSYTVNGEVTDDAGRKTVGSAQVDAIPPKTRDVVVQLVWTNFDASDDADTFPRVKLRARDEGPKGRVCTAEAPISGFCHVKTHSAYTHMTLEAADKYVPVSVTYQDERVDKGPLVCVQVWFDGARAAETCDRQHRDPDETWEVGLVDVANGKLLPPAAAKPKK